MAKNIDFMGATFPDVPSIRLPQHEGGLVSFDDTSDGDIQPADVAQGKIGYAQGQRVVGTAVAPTGSQTFTENGTFDVTALAEAVINVAGGGGGGYKLIYSDDLVVNTTSTSATLVKNISIPDAIGKNILYIRVRDNEGKRTSHYYGLDSIYTYFPIEDSASNMFATGWFRYCWYFGASDYGVMNGNYGIYLDNVSGENVAVSGNARIMQRYNSSYTKTINSTYHIDIYALDTPTT